MGSPAPVYVLRPRGMLRLVEEQTRDQALSSIEASDHSLDRTRRDVDVVLRGRDLAWRIGGVSLAKKMWWRQAFAVAARFCT